MGKRPRKADGAEEIEPAKPRKRRKRGASLGALLRDPRVVPTPAMLAHEAKIAASLEAKIRPELRDSFGLLGGALLSAFARDADITVEIDGVDVDLTPTETRAVGERMALRHGAKLIGRAAAAALGARRLEAGGFAGWALSTSSDALQEVLALCPREARVCPWVKPCGVARTTIGLSNRWEPLIVVRGRQVPPGVRDFLYAMPARKGGTLLGRKPIAFCAFLFAALGMRQGDALDDLYPGTGIVSRAWRNVGGVVELAATDRSVAEISPTRRGRPRDGLQVGHCRSSTR